MQIFLTTKLSKQKVKLINLYHNFETTSYRQTQKLIQKYIILSHIVQPHSSYLTLVNDCMAPNIDRSDNDPVSWQSMFPMYAFSSSGVCCIAVITL